MLKPERIWAVGDRTFPTYEDARTYIASRRGELQFKNLAIDPNLTDDFSVNKSAASLSRRQIDGES
jgi:hypothetical protein